MNTHSLPYTNIQLARFVNLFAFWVTLSQVCTLFSFVFREAVTIHSI
jgi:hypothetical protein